ncbi:hypothetical protein BQ8794_90077 [Mesorhizobium prunaredense]|uniref:Uncharacterized protein n=1 Tax=Mesorhizobium prunaredense TaxID=1631249 RepID=A0A1R3VLZ1_9HYPH|nr:hypothetical protein BQ8794_90077 [Mesorhizobium prunaredense]
MKTRRHLGLAGLPRKSHCVSFRISRNGSAQMHHDRALLQSGYSNRSVSPSMHRISPRWFLKSIIDMMRS